MKTVKILSVIFVLFINLNSYFAQQLTKEYFDKNLEVYFKFSIFSKSELQSLDRVISIDNVKGNEVYAYANFDEYRNILKLGYKLEILPHPGDVKEVKMSSAVRDIQDWNTYPTYQGYVDMMNQFAANYPGICRLVDAGTTVQNRKILFVIISDNVNVREAEPQFMYTSTMHGDETTGYVLMLRLIDSLLTSYGTSPRITNLINNAEIWINPNGNPDGTYYGGNNSVSGARRFNANGYDINRNFRDPAEGHNPTGPYQPETTIMMNLADNNHFILSANFHGGTEVVNYPWDTWARLHPDDSWYRFISREYADTVHDHAPATYMNGFDDGITNGYDWYRVVGGRQDYYTYFDHGRELTVEISDTKLLSASQLPAHWEYNKRSFFNYMEQCLYGLRGIVTNQLGVPIRAKVSITGHDADSSFVYSDPENGNYHRMIKAGTYNFTFSADGYNSQTFNNVVITDKSTVTLNVQLISPSITDWQTEIMVSDAGGMEASQTVVFGKAVSATDGIDPQLGEANIASNPVPGVFDARFILPGGNKSIKDFRASNLSSITWNLKFQPGSSGYPVSFRWDPNSLPPGDFYFQDQISGSIVNLDMKSTNTLVLNNTSVTALNIVYSLILNENVTYNEGWNIVSIPVEASDMDVSAVFPTAVGSAFEYNGVYNTVTEFENGKGYWLKFNSSGNTPVNGNAVGNEIEVNSGWNMIGPLDRSIPISNITSEPEGIITSNFYEYNGVYSIANTLLSGKGYWIKVSQAGILTLNNYSPPKKDADVSGDIKGQVSDIKISASDGVSFCVIDLYAGIAENAGNGIDGHLGEYLLPPAIPAGFDARFIIDDNTGSAESYHDYRCMNIAEGNTIEYILKYSLNNSSGGLMLNFDLSNAESINISDMSGGEIINETFYGSKNVFSNPFTKQMNMLKITIQFKNEKYDLFPSEFALMQNYPNPFNPFTVIEYNIPEEVHIILKVYDILGREVNTLVNEIKKPGVYQTEFDASVLPSGIYIYSLKADGVFITRKMCLIK